MAESSTEAEATLARIRRHISPGSALSAKILGGGAVEVSARGATVVLSDGRRLLDFGSYGVPLLGHRHPAVLAALSEALDHLPTATRVLPNPSLASLAAELAERCGEPLQRVWLGSDGSDAVEAALKLARRASGHRRVLAVENGFHGKTMGALALTANPAFHVGLESLLEWTTRLPRNDPDAVRREVVKGDVAALVFEPIQGEGGVHPLEIEVLRRWVTDAHAAGTFVISDEVQVGLGRCGPFSPSIAANLEPDAVLLGKALGGGVMPLSAVVATEALAGPLIVDPTWHTSTFGGHPLACVAARAGLNALADAAPAAATLSGVLEQGLAALAREHEGVIVAVRGEGLLWGIELSTPGAAGAALIELARRGLLVSPCLGSNRTIRLLPPMVTSCHQAEESLSILKAALSTLGPYL